VRWELPHEIPPVSVPALSIQPLVENAVRHGVERMAQGDIEIAVSTTPDTVVVRISNPMPPPAPGGHDGHRVGLHASQARIEALTGGRGGVRTEGVGGRVVAAVGLPGGGGRGRGGAGRAGSGGPAGGAAPGARGARAGAGGGGVSVAGGWG